MHIGHADVQVARRAGHGMVLDKSENLDPTRDRRVGIERNRAVEHVAGQRPQIVGEFGRIDGEGETNGPRAVVGDPTRLDEGLADLRAAVREVGLAGAVGEGGAVGVAHGRRYVEGDVELDGEAREGDTWRDAGEARGGDGYGGVAHAEESEGEDHQQY